MFIFCQKFRQLLAVNQLGFNAQVPAKHIVKANNEGQLSLHQGNKDSISIYVKRHRCDCIPEPADNATEDHI